MIYNNNTMEYYSKREKNNISFAIGEKWFLINNILKSTKKIGKITL